MGKFAAILIVGPTGSGKTPLGDSLQDRGFHGITCHHFDFGEQLRACEKDKCEYLTPAEQNTIHVVLKSNVLLQDSQFPIAEKILKAFIGQRRVRDRDLIVMNGLPRHTGQAEALMHLINMVMIVELHADPRIILKRIHENTGGDRSGRSDDSEREVRYKLKLFHENNAPLLEYYKERGAPVRTLHVDLKTDPELLISRLVL